MRLDVATQNDFDAIIAFYDDVTERTPEMATYARWSKGRHPTVEGIKAYIDEGSIYLYRESGWTDFYFFDYAQQHVFEYKNK